MLVVAILLETVNESLLWHVAPENMPALRRALEDGELGAARIVAIDPASSALRRALSLPSIEVAQ